MAGKTFFIMGSLMWGEAQGSEKSVMGSCSFSSSNGWGFMKFTWINLKGWDWAQQQFAFLFVLVCVMHSGTVRAVCTFKVVSRMNRKWTGWLASHCACAEWFFNNLKIFLVCATLSAAFKEIKSCGKLAESHTPFAGIYFVLYLR